MRTWKRLLRGREERRGHLRMLGFAGTHRHRCRVGTLVGETLEQRTLLSAKIFPAMPALEQEISATKDQRPAETDIHFHLSDGMDSGRYLPPQQHLFNTAGFLSEPSSAPPLEVAFDYLASHAADLGLARNDVQDALVTDHYVSEHTGVTHIYLRQMYGGLEVTGADININVTSDGQVINVGSTFLAGLGVAAGFPQPALTAVQALGALGSEFDWELDAAPAVLGFENGIGQSTLLAGAGVSGDAIPATLHYVPTPGGGVELAWNLIVETAGGDHWFDASVSAFDGDMIALTDWVHDAGEYNVFALPLESPSDGGRTLEVDPDNAIASPFGWHDTDGVAGAEFTITQGNYVHAYLDRDGNGLPDTASSPDGGASLIFDFPLDLGQEPDTYQDAAVTNLFYWNNVLHDIHYQYGFDEASGNFQVNNYGNGGAGGDGVRAEAQDGADVGNRNNANIFVPPDGTSPRMQMFLFDRTTPLRDGDLDNGIIAHEYGHGVSVRLTGGPSNVGALDAIQSGGMGEGWSDWHSLMLTQIASDAAGDSRGVGTYALGQAPDGPGIRTLPYSYDMAINSHTYGDISGLAFPHGMGEVWAATLWDLNWALIEGDALDPSLPGPGLGFDPDFYNGTGGNNLAMQLVMDGMKLQPATPSFLDARDAILLADELLTGGESEFTIWSVFARRGMGFSADDGGSANSTIITEAFDLPSTSSGILTLDAERYETGDSVTITVRDSDLAGGGPIDVTVVSDRGDSETVTLTQVGSSDVFGLFQGSIPISASGAVDDGALTAVTGDILTVTYNDADDGTGSPAVLTATADVLNFVEIYNVDFSDADGAPDLDGFTIDNTGGAATGLWHLSTGRGSQPGHSSDDSMYFGTGEDSTGGGNYDVGRTAGRITSPVINLTGKTAAELTFNYFLESEDFFDVARVLVSENFGPFTLVADKSDGLTNPTAGWTAATVDLTPFVGKTIRIRFEFDTLDDIFNDFEGWYVDDVAVRAAGARLFAVPTDGTDDIVELDAVTGVEISRFAAPEAVSGDADGLAFDGSTLFFLNGSGTDTLWELDPETGAPLDSTPLTAGSGDYGGLAVLRGSVYLLDVGANDLLEFDPLSNTFTRTVDIAGATLTGGLAGITRPDRLLAIDSSGSTVVEIDPATGLVSNSFEPSGPGAGEYAGVAVVGSDLHLSRSSAANAIDVYTRDGQFQSKTALPYLASSLGGDDRIGGEIAGQLWNDRDGDGLPGLGEPRLNGWVVALFDDQGALVGTQETTDIDLDGNGVIDQETERGRYSFPGLAAGDYTVKQVLPPGWDQTSPGSTSPAIFSQDFESGLGPDESRFGGFTVNNTNAPLNNGSMMLGHPRTYGNNEYSYYEVTLDLTGHSNVQLQFDYTARIEDLFDGFNVQASTSAVSPPDDLLTPLSGLPHDVTPFALPELGAITYDGNGLFDSNVATYDLSPFDDQVVHVRFQFGSDSSVRFPGVNIDNLLVRSVAPREVSVGADRVVAGVDFGNHVPFPAEIHGQKWNDIDGNGVRDPGELGLNGWQIELYDEQRALVATATTADRDLDGDGEIDPETERGRYSFPELLAGTYTVVETQQAGWTQTSPGSGDTYYLSESSVDHLLSVDSSGSVNRIGLFGPALVGLAYDGRDDILYGLGFGDGLYTINRTTGAATLLGSIPPDPTFLSFGLTYNPLDDRLYSVTGSGELVQIDPETLSRVTVTTPGPGTGGGGLAYNPSDQRIYVYSNSTPRVYSYDATTFAGPVTHTNPTVGPDFFAMTHDGAGLVLSDGPDADQNIYAYDPANGTTTPLFARDLLDGFTIDGMTFIPASAGVAGTQTLVLGPGQTIAAIDFGGEPPYTSLIDDGDPGYSDTGDWQLTPIVEGREGDVRFAPAGNGSRVATYQFGGLTPGHYQVFATWSAHPNRATNAPYTIRDGAAGDVLSTVLVNQEMPPDDFADVGGSWEELTVVTITGTELVVEISDAGNQFVIADAIRIEPISTPPPLTESLIIDDGEAGYADTGWAVSPVLEGRLNDIRYRQAGNGSETATWTFTGLTLGNYAVAATWSPHANRATNAPFTIYDGIGGDLLEVIRVDQEIAPADFTANGSSWKDLAVVTISGSELVVELSNDADQYVIADAIRIERTTDGPALRAGTIIDDGDAEFTTTAGWNLTPVPEGRDDDIRYAAPGNGSRIATWTFTGLTVGTYRVSATWSAHANRASDAPYTLYDGATPLVTVDVNQKQAPDDFTTQGSTWDDLTGVEITGDTLVVELSNNADGFVIADAIRIQPLA